MQYPINEIFYSLQGEANFAGLPSVFIRMQGCAVGCAFCDTKHTWELNPATQQSAQLVVEKTFEHSASWAYFNADDILHEIKKYSACRHIVFTGGEPAMYDLRSITEDLHAQGYTTQIETSGTEPLRLSDKTWVTLSPKIDMPGHKQILAENVARANEVKMPIGKMADIIKLKQLLSQYTINTQLIWLQPLSCKETPTKLCIEQALANNWRVSTQIHKFINIH
jgi:7-carboxy-7-deazaguanine synthase